MHAVCETGLGTAAEETTVTAAPVVLRGLERFAGEVVDESSPASLVSADPPITPPPPPLPPPLFSLFLSLTLELGRKKRRLTSLLPTRRAIRVPLDSVAPMPGSDSVPGD